MLLVTLVLLWLRPHPHLNQSTAALLYVLVVLVNSGVSGLGVGIATSLLSFVAINYFFMLPYETIGFLAMEDAVHMGTFLCVAVVVSSLTGRARSHAEHAMRHAAHLDMLYQLGQRIGAEVERERILPLIADTTVRLLDAHACQILLPDEQGRLVVQACMTSVGKVRAGTTTTTNTTRRCRGRDVACHVSPTKTVGTIRVLVGKGDGQRGASVDTETSLCPIGSQFAPIGDDDVIDVPVQYADQLVGMLRLVRHARSAPLRESEHDGLQMIASQVALVLERARLVETSRQARVLAEANHLKSTLLSLVSHNLRTPLAVMKGDVSNLLDEQVQWEAAVRREVLLSIDEEITRLNRLVGDVLVMSRIEAGALEHTRSWYDLPELIEQVLVRLQPLLVQHHVSLDLPAVLPPVRITYSHIDGVFTNLLENAVYHTPPGTHIVLRVRECGPMLEVAVADDGPGFPSELLPQLFEKFVRGERSSTQFTEDAVGQAQAEMHTKVQSGKGAGKRWVVSHQRPEGCGLGLAICKGLVVAHGGTIRAENGEAGGARVTFTLPCGSLE
jgi:two-component system sensor histidine kinase KdpD